jgi:TIR domain
MTRVFVSHSSKDNYFVSFLAEVLKYHRIDVWTDQSDLKAGRDFTLAIERALEACDSMIVVISENSSKSQWVTREISAFKAREDRIVIPLVLDARADPDEIYDGLGLITQLRCYESFLESFRELLRLLGGTLFPVTENRKIPDRRAGERREEPSDRRSGSIERRLRVGMHEYIQSSGRDLVEPMDRMTDVGTLAKLLAGDRSPLKSFSFTDRQTGGEVQLDFRMIEKMAFDAWYPRSRQASARAGAEPDPWGRGMASLPADSDSGDDLTGAGYITDEIANVLMENYLVMPKERRSGNRRRASRRKDEEQDS